MEQFNNPPIRLNGSITVTNGNLVRVDFDPRLRRRLISGDSPWTLEKLAEDGWTWDTLPDDFTGDRSIGRELYLPFKRSDYHSLAGGKNVEDGSEGVFVLLRDKPGLWFAGASLKGDIRLFLECPTLLELGANED